MTLGFLSRLYWVAVLLVVCSTPAPFAQCADEPCLFPAVRGGRAGFINTAGNVVVPFDFEGVGFFHQQLAAARTNGSWGFIGEDGKYQIPPAYLEVSSFTHSMAVCKTRTNWLVIGTNGAPLRSFGSSSITPWAADLVRMGAAPTTRLVRVSTGAVVGEFQLVDELSDGLAVTAREGGFGYVDSSGRISVPLVYDETYRFTDGMGRFRTNGLWGYLNTSCAVAIPAQFSWAGEFGQGLAPVRSGVDWGFIDRSGKFVIRPQYESALRFAEGLAPGKLNGRWGYVDKSGQWAVKPTYLSATPFEGGLARVERTLGKSVFIRTDGEPVGVSRFLGARFVGCGLSIVNLEFTGTFKSSYLRHRDGEIVWTDD